MEKNCSIQVDLINDDEYIGDSLKKINNNFNLLKTEACKIENAFDNRVNIRTFFYYGPNSPTDSESGMMTNTLTRPSNATIENFVNTPAGLNLTTTSEKGDMAYVIYQKTGWFSSSNLKLLTGSGTASYTRLENEQYTAVEVTYVRTRRIGIGWISPRPVYRTVTRTRQVYRTYYAGYTWTTPVRDTYNLYTPIFVIYRLTYNGTRYSVDTGFPKYSRASTASTANWNNPKAWSIY